MYLFLHPIYIRQKSSIRNKLKNQNQIKLDKVAVNFKNTEINKKLKTSDRDSFRYFENLEEFYEFLVAEVVGSSTGSENAKPTTTLIGYNLKNVVGQLKNSKIEQILLQLHWFDVSLASYFIDEKLPTFPETLSKAKFQKFSQNYADNKKWVKSFLDLYRLEYNFEKLEWRKTEKSIRFIHLEMRHIKVLYKMENFGVPYNLQVVEKLLTDWYKMKAGMEKKCNSLVESGKINTVDYNFTLPINFDNLSVVQHLIYATGYQPAEKPVNLSAISPKKRRKKCEICKNACQVEKFSTSAENLEKMISAEVPDVEFGFDPASGEGAGEISTVENPAKLQPAQVPALTKSFIQKIIDYRKLKRRIDELENLKQFRNQSGRITYTTSFTETGRIQMENPSLLTISNGVEISGKNIAPRLAFLPENTQTTKILSVDFKQIEQRVIAHLSNDQKLIKFLQQEDADFFEITAKELLGSSKERKKIKAMVYGLNYGMGVKSLAARLNTSVPEGTKIRDAYFKLFSDMNAFREKIKEVTKTESLFGRTKVGFEVL